MKAVFATGLILLPEAAAWDNVVHAYGSPFLPGLKAVEANLTCTGDILPILLVNVLPDVVYVGLELLSSRKSS